MSQACTPILAGVASFVSEISVPSKTANFPFLSMVIKNFNRLELAQKIHASRDCCHIHVSPILVGVTSSVSERLVFPF